MDYIKKEREKEGGEMSGIRKFWETPPTLKEDVSEEEGELIHSMIHMMFDLLWPISSKYLIQYQPTQYIIGVLIPPGNALESSVIQELERHFKGRFRRLYVTDARKGGGFHLCFSLPKKRKHYEPPTHGIKRPCIKA